MISFLSVILYTSPDSAIPSIPALGKWHNSRGLSLCSEWHAKVAGKRAIRTVGDPICHCPRVDGAIMPAFLQRLLPDHSRPQWALGSRRQILFCQVWAKRNTFVLLIATLGVWKHVDSIAAARLPLTILWERHSVLCKAWRGRIKKSQR